MNIKVSDIIKIVSHVFGVSRLEILSVRRFAKNFPARNAVYGLAKKWTSMSFPQIGRAMANRDHTTVLYGNKRFKQMLRSDADYVQKVRRVEIVLAYLHVRHDLNERFVS